MVGVDVQTADGVLFESSTEILIIGAGACGHTAALAANDAGAEVLMVERDPVPSGSTALSSGMIPACGTRFQSAKGVNDDVERFAADILKKARNETDPEMVRAVCREAGPALEWLVDEHGIELDLVEGFLYPGHSCLRMHATPEMTGAEFMAQLISAAERSGIHTLCDALATTLFTGDDAHIHGVKIIRPDGQIEQIECEALILACNGYGGNKELIAQHIPDMMDALYFGHAGNQGEAILWGEALGAAIADLGAFQGHGSVASPEGILITWALMSEGGIMVNSSGTRFSNENEGYSEHGRRVMAQPNGIAWCVFDRRLHQLGMTFPDYREADALGAVRQASSLSDLANLCKLPQDALHQTLVSMSDFRAGKEADPHGRDFTTIPDLQPPFYAIRVTGASFHTQGGLIVDPRARVQSERGPLFDNLFAGGGAARGLSGPSDWGYLSGNGLLTAVTLGRIAGREAAAMLSP
ncbi:MAG: FAD-dependent oxidoreductase [Pseudomonadota bacterium]|nr:FAD-dependent oxidoreductase [Pseudomonadota bacterium]